MHVIFLGGCLLKRMTGHFQVCFATCFDPKILADLQANEGKLLHLKPTSADIVYR